MKMKSERTFTIDTDGTVVQEPDVEKWFKWFGDNRDNYRLVERVGDAVISTVFLGAGVMKNEAGKYYLWETLHRGKSGESLYQFTTQDAAYQFHAGIVAGLIEKAKPAGKDDDVV